MSSAVLGALPPDLPILSYPKGVVIEPEGHSAPRLRVVVDGWVACVRELRDGARQILRLALPGEALLSRSFTGPALYGISALSRVRLVDLGPIETAQSCGRPSFVRPWDGPSRAFPTLRYAHDCRPANG